MPCLVSCLALFAPRLALVLVWLFSGYLGEAYRTTVWPLLGFVFMPYTTLAYAWAWHHGSGSVAGLGLAVVVLAVLVDLGVVGGSGRAERRRRARLTVGGGD
jgi:hypothetical protein